MTSLTPTEGTSDDDIDSFLDPSMADTARFPTSRPKAAEDSGEALDEDPDDPDTVRSPKQALRA
jgi:hypothetical protein